MLLVGMRSSLLLSCVVSMVFLCDGSFGFSGGRKASICTAIFVFGGVFSNLMMIPLKGFDKAYTVNPIYINDDNIMMMSIIEVNRVIS